MADHDVAIIGAGPVGLLLACLLAQRGLDIAVYEQRADADDRSRAIGIHPPGRAALDAAGLGEQVRDEALALEGGEVICRGRVLASLSFRPGQQVLILPQRRTDALLRERLARLQPDALNCTSTVRDVQDEGEAVRLSVEAGGVLTEVTAAFVVAADGVHSGIRSGLGLKWRDVAGKGSYVMMDVADPVPSARVRLHCEPSGIVESFPLPGGMRRWVLGDQERVVQDAEGFALAIENRTGIRMDFEHGAVPTSFLAQQHRAERVAVGRVVLVGDAAHETSPIGGQGMNLGWTAVLRLAGLLEQSLRGGTLDVVAYGRHTLRVAGRAQRRSRFYMAMGAPASGTGLAGRNALIRTLGSAPFRERAAGMITMRGL